MRPITQHEAESMRAALKTIAGFLNPAAPQDGAQTAARQARETLEELNLFFETNSEPEPAKRRDDD